MATVKAKAAKKPVIRGAYKGYVAIATPVGDGGKIISLTPPEGAKPIPAKYLKTVEGVTFPSWFRAGRTALDAVTNTLKMDPLPKYRFIPFFEVGGDGKPYSASLAKSKPRGPKAEKKVLIETRRGKAKMAVASPTKRGRPRKAETEAEAAPVKRSKTAVEDKSLKAKPVDKSSVVQGSRASRRAGPVITRKSVAALSNGASAKKGATVKAAPKRTKAAVAVIDNDDDDEGGFDFED